MQIHILIPKCAFKFFLSRWFLNVKNIRLIMQSTLISCPNLGFLLFKKYSENFAFLPIVWLRTALDSHYNKQMKILAAQSLTQICWLSQASAAPSKRRLRTWAAPHILAPPWCPSLPDSRETEEDHHYPPPFLPFTRAATWLQTPFRVLWMHFLCAQGERGGCGATVSALETCHSENTIQERLCTHEGKNLQGHSFLLKLSSGGSWFTESDFCC